MKKLSILLALTLMLILTLTACSPAFTATHNIKTEAENFSLYRRITAINLRSDKVLFEIEGFFNYENEVDGDLSIVMHAGDNQYVRHVVRMTEGTTFIVEQLDASNFSPYSYKIRIYAVYPDLELAG